MAKKKTTREPSAARHRRAIRRRLKFLPNVTVTELAELAEVNRCGLSTFLNKGGNPTCDWLDRIKAALDRLEEIRDANETPELL